MALILTALYIATLRHFWNPIDGKYNYCGPFTKLDERLARGDKGINELDEVCKQHDIAYRDAKGNKKKNWAADKKMTRRFKPKERRKPRPKLSFRRSCKPNMDLDYKQNLVVELAEVVGYQPARHHEQNKRSNEPDTVFNKLQTLLCSLPQKPLSHCTSALPQ